MRTSPQETFEIATLMESLVGSTQALPPSLRREGLALAREMRAQAQQDIRRGEWLAEHADEIRAEAARVRAERARRQARQNGGH